MERFGCLRLRQRFVQRKAYGKCRTMSEAIALGSYRSAVEFSQSFDQRQSQTQTALVAIQAALCLAERLEDGRERIGAHSDACIGDFDFYEFMLTIHVRTQ